MFMENVTKIGRNQLHVNTSEIFVYNFIIYKMYIE